jgi:predicted Fe-Mo cluster-binding NifX family protein
MNIRADNSARRGARRSTASCGPVQPPVKCSRVAFSVDSFSSDAAIGARFGRCAAFVIAELNCDDLMVVPNPAADQSEGAGVTAARFIIDSEVHAVVSGAFGRVVPQMLADAGIATYRLNMGDVRDLVEGLRRRSST